MAGKPSKTDHRDTALVPLDRGFVRAARENPLQLAMADLRTPPVSFASALIKAIYLSRRLAPLWRGQEMVGLLLPPSVGGALANLAALLLGKVPVNLNYTMSSEVLAACARQAELKTVVTSRAFLERVPLRVPGETILIEEAAGNPRPAEKLAALALAWLTPVPLLERALGRPRSTSLDDLATVIFSSGSTGEPKGVMLTHCNVAANILQMQRVFHLSRRDRMLGILPFFHAFGFTVTLGLPVTCAVGGLYHTSPLEAESVGELAGRHGATVLVATPTFLQTYCRRCQPEQFRALRLVLVGAEKLAPRIAQAFESCFGVAPLEGYGCTECAPVVAVNPPGRLKPGTVGLPVPGVEVRIADPETFEPLPAGTPGMLLVRGENVMKGYLGRPEETAQVLRDGWYVTGDIAALDPEGYIVITDRMARFSKIGGEMVPHVKVEERLHELAGTQEQTFTVTGVPDEKKGERLVVLHTLGEEPLRQLIDTLAESDLPKLWAPRPNQFFRVEKLPYLGTGKLDLRRIRELAQQFSRSE